MISSVESFLAKSYKSNIGFIQSEVFYLSYISLIFKLRKFTGMSMVFRQCEDADGFSAWIQKQILFHIHHKYVIFPV